MSTKNLVINNGLGSFTFNEDVLKALETVLVCGYPVLNRELNTHRNPESGLIDDSYFVHLEDAMDLVRHIYDLILER